MEIVPSSHGFTAQFIGKTIGSSDGPPLADERLACPQEASPTNFVAFPYVLLNKRGLNGPPEGFQVIIGDPDTAFANCVDDEKDSKSPIEK